GPHLKRLRAQARLGHIAARPCQSAEAPGVHEVNLAAGEPDADVRVLQPRPVSRAEGQPPGHAQVGKEGVPVAQAKDDPFCAPLEACNRSPLDGGSPVKAHGAGEIPPQELETLDSASDDGWPKGVDNGLYFR